MIRPKPSIGIAAILLAGSFTLRPATAATIGVDAVHGFNAAAILGTGSNFDAFRGFITLAGHGIVPLANFEAADLAGLDGLILGMPYSQNGADYSPSEISAIQAFARRAVFVSDTDMFGDVDSGSDRPIGFGSNLLLLQNIISFIVRKGVLFAADNGTGFNVANMNALVRPYGITYASAATDASGRTISGFVPHPITATLISIGVDFQLPITTMAPSVDLTTGSGQDNVLSVYEPCPFLAPLRDAPEGPDTIDTLYRFRDRVMAGTYEGRRFIGLYYRHAPEAARLLLTDRDLRVGTRALLVRLGPKLQARVDGKTMDLTADELAAVERLMNLVGRRASRRLRSTIWLLRQQLRNERLLARFGFRIAN